MVVKSFFWKEERVKVLKIERISMDFCHSRMMKIEVQYGSTEERKTKTIILSNAPTVITGGKIYGNRQPADFESIWNKLKEGDLASAVHLEDDNWVFLRG